MYNLYQVFSCPCFLTTLMYLLMSSSNPGGRGSRMENRHNSIGPHQIKSMFLNHIDIIDVIITSLFCRIFSSASRCSWRRSLITSHSRISSSWTWRRNRGDSGHRSSPCGTCPMCETMSSNTCESSVSFGLIIT